MVYSFNALLLVVHFLSNRGWGPFGGGGMDLSNPGKAEATGLPSNGIICGACLQ